MAYPETSCNLHHFEWIQLVFANYYSNLLTFYIIIRTAKVRAVGIPILVDSEMGLSGID